MLISFLDPGSGSMVEDVGDAFAPSAKLSVGGTEWEVGLLALFAKHLDDIEDFRAGSAAASRSIYQQIENDRQQTQDTR